MDPDRADIAAEIRRIVRVVRKQWWLLLVCAVVAGAAAYVIADRQGVAYESSARLLIRSYQADVALPNTPPFFVDPVRDRATAAELVTSPQVGTSVYRQLGARVRSVHVSASTAGDTDVILITAQAPDPRLAALTANAYAQHYIYFRRAQNADRYLAAAHVIERKLARERALASGSRRHKRKKTGGASSAEQASAFALALLKQQALRMHLYADTQTADAQIVQSAAVPGAALPRHQARDALLGGAFGLLIGLSLAFLRDRLMNRIDTEDQLGELASDLAVLGYIPGGRGRRWTPVIAEGYHGLCAALGPTPPQGRSVLVTSAQAGEGKSTTAVNLSLALVERGEQALLVDADLRRTKVSRQLNSQSPGLAGVLAGRLGLDEAVERTTFEPTRSSGDGPRVALSGALAVVPAGGPTERPRSLFTDSAVDGFLTTARSRSRNVIIDGPPIGPVADMAHVARLADVVLVVVRLEHTRPGPLGRLLSQLKTAGVTPEGFVIIGADTGEYYR